jgi:hypothetical protein
MTNGIDHADDQERTSDKPSAPTKSEEKRKAPAKQKPSQSSGKQSKR